MVIADHDTDIIGQPKPPGGMDSTHTDRTLEDREAVVEAVEYAGGRAKRGQDGTGWGRCAHRISIPDPAVITVLTVLTRRGGAHPPAGSTPWL